LDAKVSEIDLGFRFSTENIPELYHMSIEHDLIALWVSLANCVKSIDCRCELGMNHFGEDVSPKFSVKN